jgi:chromosome segregation ATPase
VTNLEATVAALQEAVNTMQTTLVMVNNAITNNTNSTQSLNESVKDLRTQMSKEYVRKDVLEPTLETIKANVKEHDDWITWVTRIVLSAIIIAVIGGVIVTGK